MRKLLVTAAWVISSGLVLSLTACSSVSKAVQSVGSLGSDSITVALQTRPGASPVSRNGQALRLLLSETRDVRLQGERLARKVGDVRATVMDLHGTQILLAQPAVELVNQGIRQQLVADGFQVVEKGQAFDWEVQTKLIALELNVGQRDELGLSVEVSLREAATSELIWSAVVAERSDRFAGIAGNTRSTLASYLSEGLTNLNQRMSHALRSALLASYPNTVSALAAPAAAPAAVPGLSVIQGAVARDRVRPAAPTQTLVPAAPVAPASVAPAASAAAPRATVAPPAAGAAASGVAPAAAGVLSMLPGYGYVSVVSIPTRVKVYSDDIYYGLTPLKVMVPVGVMSFEFRFDGLKTQREKVSVRAGQTTELELKLSR